MKKSKSRPGPQAKEAPKWGTLSHNGILFPPKYETRGITVKINGREVALNLGQEEMAYQWAKKKDTPYVQDAVFQKNFTADFARALGPEFRGLKYSDIDFGRAYRVADKERDAREMMSKEERKALAAKRKEVREEMKAKYGTAVMDGNEVDVANYMAEPPGIFIGRGDHPLRGKWKPRVGHADVVLNLGKEAPVPEGDWKEIVHLREATWLASWTDHLTQKRKYVWLADTAGLKQDRDRAKYEKAVGLSKEIHKIKDRMIRDMSDGGGRTGEVATACYLIYRTAMRVGDEKDPDEADTVGATTLRKEHIRITNDAIKFDFLGKDSVRWQETVKAEGHDRTFKDNLARLVEKKSPKDQVFAGITSRHVNAYYRGIVDGLSAKVFRTYLATSKVREYLLEHDDMAGESANKKLYHAKLANLEAAVMCNHKRTIPKTFEQSLQKKRDTLKAVEGQRAWTKTQAALKKARESKPKTSKQKKARSERIKRITEQVRRQKERHAERVERLRLQIDLAERTRDYNLGTSLRNYIDPRIFKAWTDEMGAEWEKLYTAALQKKFLWVGSEMAKWGEIKAAARARPPGAS